MKNKLLYWIPKFLTIILGTFFIIFGEFDDSPGLQGIGLILIMITVFYIVRKIYKKN